VSQQIGEQGALGARLLLEALDGGVSRAVTVPTRLVVRASTCPQPSSGPDTAVAGITSRLWREVTILDTSLSMTRAFAGCRSAAEVVSRFAAALPRLGVRRCFFVMFYQPRSVRAATQHPDARLIGRMVLVQRDGVVESVANRPPFEVSTLLPQDLAPELADGTLMLQPLSTDRGELGYLLLELNDPDRFVGDAIRRDLCRTLELLAHNAELSEYADDLERLVGRRTSQLESEITTRRGAEETLRRLNEELQSQLHVDGLTGLTNRAGFDDQLAIQWSAHSRSNSALSLLMVDVDHFKKFNDTYGHLAGDECLRIVARCLSRAVQRPNDVTARYGGEEFAAILPNTQPAGALVIAARLRELLAEAAVAHSGSPHGVVTVSVGAATAYPDPSPNAVSLVADADVALYAAKAAGRDRVIAAEGGLLTS
jgi:diguanylate cyclase (GGDEF)-like protein